MSKLILLRHLKSQWNLENRFAGWTDGPLCLEGKATAGEISRKLSSFRIDKIYTSSLFRNMDTVSRIFENSRKYPFFIHLDGGKMQKWGNYEDISEDDIPTYVSEALNERYYGKLQGLDKKETIKKYGEDRVHLWRRGYKEAPPSGESLADVVKRSVAFYKKCIESDLKNGQNVLVVASHNSLRALVKYIERMPDNEIINFEIAYGGLLGYEFKKGIYRKLN